MTATITYTCDHCQERVVLEPLSAGKHSELRVRVAYPQGWDFDDDGDAMCPACTDKNKAAA